MLNKNTAKRSKTIIDNLKNSFTIPREMTIKLDIDFSNYKKGDKVIALSSHEVNDINLKQYGIKDNDLVLTCELIPGSNGLLQKGNYRVFKYVKNEKNQNTLTSKNLSEIKKYENINQPASSHNIFVIGKVIKHIKC